MALPYGTTGSLRPTFVPARLVGLAVKLPYAIALDGWFPISLREPSRASVTLWEATAPVKLPTRRCPRPRFLCGTELESSNLQGGISLVTPPELAPRFQSLPPILHSKSKNSAP